MFYGKVFLSGHHWVTFVREGGAIIGWIFACDIGRTYLPAVSLRNNSVEQIYFAFSLIPQLERLLAEHVLFQALYSSHHSCQSFSTSLAGFKNWKTARQYPSVGPESR